MTRERKLYIDSTQQSSPPAGATATSSQTGSLSESKTGEGSRKSQILRMARIQLDLVREQVILRQEISMAP